MAAMQDIDRIQGLTRAAREARLAEEYEMALGRLSRALVLVARSRCLDCLPEIAELIAEISRESDQARRGIAIFDQVLRRLPPESSGEIFARRASLWGYVREYRERTRDLRRAAAAFTSAGDREGQCRALADLALPVDHELPLAHRVAVGVQALEMARALGEASLVSRCATNIAMAKFMNGDPSALAHRADIAAHQPTPDATAETHVALRNWNNWATAALAYGLGDEVDHARRAVAGAPDSARKRRLGTLHALVQWRRGEWDGALKTCEAARSRPLPPEDQALLQIVSGAIEFQRRPISRVGGLGMAADFLKTEDLWAGVARAVVIDIRFERREPRPARGITSLVQRIKASEIRVGWEDLLPALGRTDAGLYRQTAAVLADLGPAGVRARACSRAGEGFAELSSRPAVAWPILEDAAMAYAELGEPFEQARCLEGAAVARNDERRQAGEHWRTAARIYQEIGAHRALTSLLRRAQGTRALAGFTVPRAYLRAASPGLTPREHEVADLARRGFTAAQIAETLTLSPHTVLTHFKHIRRKLQVRTKHELIQVLSED